MLTVLDNKVVARPNASLAPKQVFYVVGLLGLVLLLISLAFTRMGAWMVMPFAGLELLALTAAFYYVYLHSGDYESVLIEEDDVRVIKHHYPDKTEAVFQRYWTRVSLREGQDGRSALVIGSHGREVEFGRYLIDDVQREALLQELRYKLKQTEFF